MFNQLLLNGIIAGSQYSLVAVGFSLIYRTNHFLHFTHGAAYILGAYFAYLFGIQFGMPLPLAVLFSLLLCSALGAILEIVFYRPLRSRKASPAILFLTSLGCLIAIQNIVSLLWGDEMKSIRVGPVQEGMRILNAVVTPVQLLGVIVSTALGVLVLCLLYLTSVGRKVRAVAGDPTLSRIYGVNSDRMILVMFMLGSGLAGMAGILKVLDSGITPTMGFNALLMAVAAIVVGGVDSIPGAIVGGYFVGFSEHLGVWLLPTQWQSAIVFVILVLFVLLKPQGLLGRRLRRITV